MIMGKQLPRPLKLSAEERKLLGKIKDRKVKNIQVPTGLVHPRTGKKMKASAVNLSGAETRTFSRMWKRGLIYPSRSPPYFTYFRLTEKGKVSLKGRR